MININKIKEDDAQEIFDFFTDNLANATQEFQNKIKESQIYQAIQKELDKYVRVPEPIFPSKEFFESQEWVNNKKGRFIIDSEYNFFYKILEEIESSTPEIIFKGRVKTEEQFLMLEKMLGICN